MKFKEKKYYFDMFDTEIVWIVVKDFKSIKKHVKSKYDVEIEDVSEHADGAMFDITHKDIFRYLIITEIRGLEVFSHELIHVTQAIMESRNLSYNGEWYAYFYSHLMDKLYK